jgi:hypothetical protein
MANPRRNDSADVICRIRCGSRTSTPVDLNAILTDQELAHRSEYLRGAKTRAAEAAFIQHFLPVRPSVDMTTSASRPTDVFTDATTHER